MGSFEASRTKVVVCGVVVGVLVGGRLDRRHRTARGTTTLFVQRGFSANITLVG